MISFEQIAFLFKIPNDFGLSDRLSDGEPIHPPSKSSPAALTVAKHQVDWSGCNAREKLARSARRLLRFATAEKWVNALCLHYYGGPCHATEIKNAPVSLCNMKLNTPRLGAVKTLQLVSVNPPADQWEPRLPPEGWTHSAFCAVPCLLKSFSVCAAFMIISSTECAASCHVSTQAWSRTSSNCDHVAYSNNPPLSLNSNISFMLSQYEWSCYNTVSRFKHKFHVLMWYVSHY